jgi:predicted nuclease with TOPRIM domain|tara:strand:+ start:353 stop:748 length:396 start_codon:yes stop_codon:yes gene_type:complete
MNNKLDIILAEISAGELIDKITILEIKKTNISNKEKLNDVEKELSSLNETMKQSIPDRDKIKDLINRLKKVNLKLWDIEDGKRAAEKENNFGEKFIELARNVYKFNDERAKIKLAINSTLGSNIKEIKSYE